MKRRNLLIGGAALLAGAGAGSMAWRRAVGSMHDYRADMARLRAPLPPDPTITDLVHHATLAGNSHNTQPWRFRIDPGEITILPDFSRRTPVVDPDDHHLFVSLGCAAENLLIAAGASGRPGELLVGNDGRDLRYRFTEGRARNDPLLAAIPLRQSTRAEYDGRPVSVRDLETLQHASAMRGVRAVVLTERSRIDAVRDLVVAGNTTQMNDPAFRAELKHWLRFNPRHAAMAGDGLFAAASGNPVLPDRLGSLAFDHVVTAASESDTYARHIDSSAGIMVFVAERETPWHWIQVGRACQRFALTATHLGLKQAHVNQPVEVPALRPELASLIGEPGKRPDIVLRFGRGPTLPYSPRRPVESVLVS